MFCPCGYTLCSTIITQWFFIAIFRAGGPISDKSNSDLIRVPPLSVPLRQRIVEKLTKEGDGETKRMSQLQGELFAVSAKANNDTLDLVCFDILTMSESASSGELYFYISQLLCMKIRLCHMAI